MPDIREQLFQATERILSRDGPSALTSRAITNEAGCAKGILYNHFTDLDGFLAAFIVDRFRLIMERATALLSRDGEGTVIENLTQAALSVFGSNALAIFSLATSRPSLILRLTQSASAGAPSLQEIEATFAAYLNAEMKLGRIAAEADTETLALSLIGAVHHLFVTDRLKESDLSTGVHRIVTVLLADVTLNVTAPD